LDPGETTPDLYANLFGGIRRAARRSLGRLLALALQSERSDRSLAVTLRHLEVAGGIIGEVGVVVPVTPAQSLGREFSPSHVRLQLLER
jgi:hypothetical protein